MGKRKCYFNNNNKSAKKADLKFGNTIKLAPDMKGFIVTYNCKFTFVINEAKKLIQQFSITNEQEEQKVNENETDIDKLMAKELQSLNERDKELKILDTGAKYTLFVNFESINPNKIVSAIFEVTQMG